MQPASGHDTDFNMTFESKYRGERRDRQSGKPPRTTHLVLTTLREPRCSAFSIYRTSPRGEINVKLMQLLYYYTRHYYYTTQSKKQVFTELSCHPSNDSKMKKRSQWFDLSKEPVQFDITYSSDTSPPPQTVSRG